MKCKSRVLSIELKHGSIVDMSASLASSISCVRDKTAPGEDEARKKCLAWDLVRCG